MKAIIMAGGEGTRLRPLTCAVPKPMVSIMNRPVMEYIILLLKKHNITDIGVTLQYMPEVIKEYFGNGEELGVNITYFTEKSPLGTAGSVKNAEGFLDGDFLVISGDSLTDIDLGQAIDFHRFKNATATLILSKVDTPLEYGVVVTKENGSIKRFLEKPSWSEVFSDTVNTGMYILNRNVLSMMKKDKIMDFSKDLFPEMLKNRDNLFGYVAPGYWCDIGDIQAYSTCHLDILHGKVNIPLYGKEYQKGIFVENNVTIETGAKITAPSYIGEGSVIKSNASVDSYSIIGKYNVIEEYASIRRSITWNGCRAGKYAQLRGCILCNKVQIKENANVFESAVIGETTAIGQNSTINPYVKVWPNKVVDDGTTLKSNLVWGSKFTRNLFGDKGVQGEINIDITPEFATKLGAAFSALNQNSKTAVSCDINNSTYMLKTAVMSGLLSCGASVFDFGNQLLPMTRSAIKFYGLDGGIHLAVGDNGILNIDFLGSNGSNLDRNSERKLENLFVREDFIRSEHQNVPDVSYIWNYNEYYIRNLINAAGKKLNYRILLDTESPLVQKAAKELFENLGGSVYTDLNSIYDLKVFISSNGETLTLTDEMGREIDEEKFRFIACLISLKSQTGSTVVVPTYLSSAIERVAEKYNGFVLRAKSGDVMETMNCTNEMQFNLNYDALHGLCLILKFISDNNLRLYDLVNEIPKYYLSKKEVECNWGNMGKIIREITQSHRSEQLEQTEGVKIFKDGGWTLVVPDTYRPICRIISEGYSQEFANELTDVYADFIKNSQNI